MADLVQELLSHGANPNVQTFKVEQLQVSEKTEEQVVHNKTTDLPADDNQDYNPFIEEVEEVDEQPAYLTGNSLNPFLSSSHYPPGTPEMSELISHNSIYTSFLFSLRVSLIV